MDRIYRTVNIKDKDQENTTLL